VTAPTIRVEGPLRPGESCQVDGESARYLLRVRRVEHGAYVRVVAADGAVAMARVEAFDDESVALLLTEVEEAPAPPEQRLLLITSGLRSGGTSELISACAEMGVDGIALTNMQRSVARVDKGKLDRYSRVASDACRKVAQPRQTEVEVHGSLAEAVDAHPEAAVFVLNEDEGLAWEEVALPGNEEIVVVVGPEGGFEVHELGLLRSIGATSVRLRGPAYRARTAAFAGTVLFLSLMKRL
jgi:16S rRNA (uracil1498-N3)-methyltransferase